MAIKKRPVSPRQKMINLMYVVLMAMLALNVSSEVLDGFSVVSESLQRTTISASRENQNIYNVFEQQMLSNPTKVKEWYDKAQEVQRISDSLYIFTESLKNAIIREADGKEAVVDSLQNKDDLEAAAQVMLAPGIGKGKELYNAINNYKNRMVEMVDDSLKIRTISTNLSTDVPKTSDKKKWTEYMFDSMPAISAVTMLTKLQSDIRYAEGEVLHSLLANIDMNDVRVNSLDAFVIPEAKTIVRGNHFTANIVMAAVDTTQKPKIFIGGKETSLTNGKYDILCSKTGDFTLSGWLETQSGNGEKIKKSFSQKYTVIEPTATVSADLMNVLYAGYDNPISISVPGAPLTSISATMVGGSLKHVAPGKYIAKPSKPGQNAVITVFSDNHGSKQQMAVYTFKVRRLPEPSPYIDVKDEQGNSDRFKGGAVTKTKLLSVNRIGAAVDDGILHIPFKVLSFEIVFFDNMGNAIPIASESADLTKQQLENIRKSGRNKRLYITHLTVVGPDGVKRTLNTSMEIIIK